VQTGGVVVGGRLVPGRFGVSIAPFLDFSVTAAHSIGPKKADYARVKFFEL
jgi:hypothetical protein